MGRTIMTPKSNVRVIWRDKIENFSKEKVKDIKNKLKHKYGVSNIRVDFSATNKLNIGLTNLDSDDVVNINRPETQEKIILQYLIDNQLDITVDDIKRLNKKVEANLEGFNESKDNKWRIKNLVIENFLSIKDKVILDFESLKGLTLIQGKNFAGKTSLIINSLQFLLFNNTSRTTVADEVINMYSNLDFASVSGELVIDNKEYKIERRVDRTWKKDKSSYKTSTSLDFYQKEDSGEYVLLNGDMRQSTDKIIQENIGNEKEFLMTVLCTGDNLFDIIKAKPTERGQLLSRFLGLEIFEQKEETAKKMYSDWRLKSKIDKYSSVTLQILIEDNEKIILESQVKLDLLKEELSRISTEKSKVVSEKEQLLRYYYRDIDQSMVNLTEDFFLNKINSTKSLIENKKTELSDNKKQLSTEKLIFNKERFDEIKNEIESLNKKILTGDLKLKQYRETITQLKSGEKCPTCGQSLKDVDHTEEIKQLTQSGIALKSETDKSREDLLNLEPKLLELEEIKEKINQQDLLQLKLDKIEVEIETLQMKVSKEEDNRLKFIQDLDKIEKNKQLDVDVRRKDIELTEVTNKEYQKNREIQGFENTINNSNNIINENKILIETIKKEEHIAKVFTIYIAMMGKNGISKTIIKNTVPVLNLELTKLLMDAAEFTVSIELNEKNNEVEFWMIDNELELKKPLTNGSGYERFIGALALRIVNSKVNTLPKPSLLLMDEVFGTVAQDNLELVKGFIEKVTHELDNVFIITHNELIKEWADNIITVIKTNNLTTVH